MAHNNPHDFFRKFTALFEGKEADDKKDDKKADKKDSKSEIDESGPGAYEKSKKELADIKKKQGERKKKDKENAKKDSDPKFFVPESGADFFRKYSDMIAEAEEADDEKKDAEKDEDESNDADDKEDKRPEWLKKKQDK